MGYEREKRLGIVGMSEEAKRKRLDELAKEQPRQRVEVDCSNTALAQQQMQSPLIASAVDSKKESNAPYRMIKWRHATIIPVVLIAGTWLEESFGTVLLTCAVGITLLGWLDAKLWHHPPTGEGPSLIAIWRFIRYMSWINRAGWTVVIACLVGSYLTPEGDETIQGLLTAAAFLGFVFSRVD